MLLNWGAVCFGFFLLNFFIKYLPGDIYINSIVSGLAAFFMLLEGPI